MAARLSLLLDLLDKQVVDADGLPVGRVDDVEITVRDGSDGPGEVAVTGLHVGAAALGPRIGGVTGEAMTRLANRLRDADQDQSAVLPVGLVGEVTAAVRLTRRLADLPGLAPLERWLSTHVVRPMAGDADAGE